MEMLFVEILPSIDVRKDLGDIQTPIFLAAGSSDYECCPWLWQTLLNFPPYNNSMILGKMVNGLNMKRQIYLIIKL